jgi:diaminohydroxyphosphoribosylaminopyrimidine deaminase/5-amino-6-(5-phosphoribosylamino)uracil reductase
MLKLATSLDGKIALGNGVSQWITSSESRAQVHRMRATHDAILTAIGTVIADNPKMTARPDGVLAGKQPLRVVLDTRLAMSPSSAILDGVGSVLIYAGEGYQDKQAELVNAGAEIVLLEADERGHLDLGMVVSDLADRGIKSVMVEGGADLAGAVIKTNLIDRIEWFRAPILLGDDGKSVISALGLETLDFAPMFDRIAVHEFGRDLWESYRRKSD